jgi:hypothetical protein
VKLLTKFEIMKYFILKTRHDNGTDFIKTAAQNEQTAKNNFCKCYGAPESAILDTLEIPKEFFSMNASHIYKNFKN